jgi:hypothetical protein
MGRGGQDESHRVHPGFLAELRNAESVRVAQIQRRARSMPEPHDLGGRGRDVAVHDDGRAGRAPGVRSRIRLAPSASSLSGCWALLRIDAGTPESTHQLASGRSPAGGVRGQSKRQRSSPDRFLVQDDRVPARRPVESDRHLTHEVMNWAQPTAVSSWSRAGLLQSAARPCIDSHRRGSRPRTGPMRRTPDPAMFAATSRSLPGSKGA